MHSVFEVAPVAHAIPITFVTKATWDAISSDLPAEARRFAKANGFSAKPGACLTLPTGEGDVAQVLFGLDGENGKFRDPFRPGQLPGLLPPGVYRFANAETVDARLAALAFALGSYRFSRYRKTDALEVRLVPPDGVDVADLTRIVEATALARDSSTRRPMTWDRRSWHSRRNSSHTASVPSSIAWSATSLRNKIFPSFMRSAWPRRARPV